MRPIIKPGEVAETPSHEFLKWLGDSLKGLNSSANGEWYGCAMGIAKTNLPG
jgi:hypothetical protein